MAKRLRTVACRLFISAVLLPHGLVAALVKGEKLSVESFMALDLRASNIRCLAEDSPTHFDALESSVWIPPNSTHNAHNAQDGVLPTDLS